MARRLAGDWGRCGRRWERRAAADLEEAGAACSSRDAAPPTTDTFAAGRLGLQWQWQANPRAGVGITCRVAAGCASARCRIEPNLWSAPNLLLQKFPAPAFTVTARIDVSELRDGERAGLIVFGADYAWVGIERAAGTTSHGDAGPPRCGQRRQRGSAGRGALHGRIRYASVAVADGGQCQFNIGPAFVARPGRWVGAKVGLFATAPLRSAQTGSVAVRSFGSV